MRRLLPALLLPILVTGVTLAGVAWNRSGGREAITLTNREFYTLPGSDDRSATRVALTWQYVTDRQSPLTREKLAAIGFDMSADLTTDGADRDDAWMLPRQAWVAFELGGPAFDALAAEAREKGSRLVPVDVSLAPTDLSARYADATRYFVTAGVVRPLRMAPKGEPPYVVGIVDSVLPRELHVPRELAPARGTSEYRVAVRYGRRFEPWIVDVSR